MRFMRLTEVIRDTGLGRSSIYKRIAEGVFPKPVPLGGRTVGWVSDEVEAWILERIERDGGSCPLTAINLSREWLTSEPATLGSTGYKA